MLDRSVHPHAFTLLELVLVMAVLALLMAVAAPSLHGWGRGAKLRDASDELLAATRFARSQAAATATMHRLEADPSGAAFRIVVADPAGDVPAAGEYAQPVELPPAVRVAIERLDGGDSVDFHPNGRLTPAVIRLYAQWGETLELAALTPADSFRPAAGGVR